MTKPPSKASQLRQANKVLLTLLKTPKTRAGLVAAVTGGAISRNFVFGWLAEGRRTGALTTLKSMGSLWYQTAHVTISEVPKSSDYPSWLDPRALPTSIGRTVVVDGVVINVGGKPTTTKKDKS